MDGKPRAHAGPANAAVELTGTTGDASGSADAPSTALECVRKMTPSVDDKRFATQKQT
jgi:hypothetical protein